MILKDIKDANCEQVSPARGWKWEWYIGVKTSESHISPFRSSDVLNLMWKLACRFAMQCRVWHFGFETSRFRNFSNYFDGIGIGFAIFWYRKKYRYRFRKNLVSKKVSVSVSKNLGIEKSIGIGFEKFWYRKKYRYRFRKILVSKKVSDSVSFRFWVSSHTAYETSTQVDNRLALVTLVVWPHIEENLFQFVGGKSSMCTLLN